MPPCFLAKEQDGIHTLEHITIEVPYFVVAAFLRNASGSKSRRYMFVDGSYGISIE